MQQNLSDQTFTAAFNPLLINSGLLQSGGLQGMSLSDMQNIQQQYQLSGLNLQNVMLNQQQQGIMMNSSTPIVGQQPNLMLLNQQNLLLNQQANQLGLYSQNQLNQLIQPGQQMLLTNLYSLNKNPLPASIVMATNLIPTSIMNQVTKQSKSTKKSKDRTNLIKHNKSNNSHVNRLNEKVIEEQICNEMSESEDDEQEIDEEDTSTEASDAMESDVDFEMLNDDQQEESDEKSIASQNEEESDDDCEEMTHDISFDDQDSNTNDCNSINLNDNTSSNCSSNSKQLIGHSIPDLRFVKKEPKDIDFDKLTDEELQPFLNEIKTFAHKFKLFRTAYNMTQQEVSKEISSFMRCSQSKLCRFEKYSSPNNQKVLRKKKKMIKAVLQTKDDLEKYIMYKENNLSRPKDTNDKIRKKRINFKSDQVKILNDFFSHTSHPSPEQIIELSRQTNHSEKEIKVWFNNKKAALRSAAKQSDQ